LGELSELRGRGKREGNAAALLKGKNRPEVLPFSLEHRRCVPFTLPSL